jgi:hypothetical protein
MSNIDFDKGLLYGDEKVKCETAAHGAETAGFRTAEELEQVSRFVWVW